MQYFFCGYFLLVMFHVYLCYAVLFVHCSRWNMAELLALCVLCFIVLLSLSHIAVIHIRTEGEISTVKHV